MIFGVMLTNKITNVEIKTGTIQVAPAAIGVGVLWGVLTATLIGTDWKIMDSFTAPSSTVNLGIHLMQEYVVVFELLGIILLIALIGAASIARK